MNNKAGGGKSFICLTKFLQYTNNPHFKAAVLRKTAPELLLPGSAIDASQAIYPHFGGEYKVQKKRWVFPSGGLIQFGAIDSLKALEGWKGSELTHIMIDEVADWPEEYVLFLLSRIRSAKFDGKMQQVLSCNPDNTSFLFKWVEWCLDEDGVPKEGTENIVRWFVVLGGKIYWADSKEELYEKYGYGKTLGKDFIPKSFRFVPCGIYQNPVLLKNNPEYLANLLAQSRINQLRFLHGSWTAKAEGTGYFKREWCEVIDKVPAEAEVVARIRGWDLAASPEPDANSSNKSPDYSAGVLVSRDRLGTYYVEHSMKFRKRSGDVVQEIINTAFMDGLDYPVGVPRDSGSGGVSWHAHLIRILSEHGILTRTDKVSGHAGKLQRFLPFASMAEAGNIKVVRGDWNDMWFEELEAFDGGKQKEKDDQCDATATAFNLIARNMVMPAFTLPDLSRSNPMPF